MEASLDGKKPQAPSATDWPLLRLAAVLAEIAKSSAAAQDSQKPHEQKAA